VNGTLYFVSWIREKTIGYGIHEFFDSFVTRMGPIVTIRFVIAIDGEAKSVQFSTVVQDAVWDDVTATHVLGDVVPVMLTHRIEAFA